MTIAEVKLWGKKIGAVAWDSKKNIANFEYEPLFVRSGIEISPKNMFFKPFQLLEYVLVPLLMRSLVIGTELARAAMTRGIDYPGKKTSYYIIRCRCIDYLCGISWTVILLAIIYMDHRIYAAATRGLL